ncbi:UNKNOWN [Stylonychia lemnae]|uniref:Uncharacterized protein n=1 Tax=Stylonychia lemnae TaxID=5949 RepID=A0A078B0X6_STYLE|nr:UNKNOWN [Stylonychia lemnae]|eukprot:CDW88290.1 UNKNOWN [Stylonychia lemnae]
MRPQSSQDLRPLTFNYQPESMGFAENVIDMLVEQTFYQLFLKQLEQKKMPYCIEHTIDTVSIGWFNAYRKPDQPCCFTDDPNEFSEPSPCPKDQWSSNLVPIQKKEIEIPNLELDIWYQKSSRKSPKKGQQSVSDYSSIINPSRVISTKRKGRTSGVNNGKPQTNKSVPLEQFIEKPKPQEEVEEDKMVDKLRTQKMKDDLRMQKILEQQRLRAQMKSQSRKRMLNKIQFDDFSNMSGSQKDQDLDYNFTTDHKGKKLQQNYIPGDKLMKPVIIGSKLLKNPSDEQFLERMRRMNRTRTSQNLMAFKKRQSLFDNYKDSLKTMTMANNEGNNQLVFNVNEKKYVKPPPPSQLIDLQAGVKIRDKFSARGGGEFTMTMRNQMSRDDYFGGGRSHRIVPPSLQSNGKKRAVESVRFSGEETERVQSTENHRAVTGDRKMQESLSTIYGDSNDLQIKKKLRNVVSQNEKIIINKRRDQIKDLLSFDKNHLWTAGKLNQVLNQNNEGDNNFMGINPKLEAQQLYSARNTFSSGYDFGIQSTAPQSSATPRVRDIIYADVNQIQAREDQLDRLRTSLTRQTAVKPIRPKTLVKLENLLTERAQTTVKIRDKNLKHTYSDINSKKAFNLRDYSETQ